MRTIFLDLDGTLVDSHEGITSTIRHALAELGAEAPPAAELTWCIGPPLRDSFEVLLGEALADEAVEIYRERYAAEGIYEADPYDGVGEMLEGLRELGRVYVATSKLRTHAESVVEHFGIDAWIDGLFGSEADGTLAHKHELLAHALETTGADPALAVMVGDRRHDVEGARANGIPCIGALWGFGEPDELRYADADALAATPEEVPEIAAELTTPEA